MNNEIEQLPQKTYFLRTWETKYQASRQLTSCHLLHSSVMGSGTPHAL